MFEDAINFEPQNDATMARSVWKAAAQKGPRAALLYVEEYCLFTARERPTSVSKLVDSVRFSTVCLDHLF